FSTQVNRSLIILTLAAAMSSFAVAQDKETNEGNPQKQQMLELWKPGDSGQRMRIRGRVTDANGQPLPNVRIRFRHADSEGINRSYHQGELETNERGIYQFGSVIPGNSHRLSHVHVYISHPGFQYLDTEFYFKDDPKANADDPNAIFLEEGNSDDNGGKMMYGRWDVALTPQ
ncbi:MAG: carboxypeptidase regulatory-like domain-containing protein, partial [Granulosicoccus sp.]|nr:carboxypeptidase regulatory-like domain-containing protein [Granulosicoccus sp.]